MAQDFGSRREVSYRVLSVYRGSSRGDESSPGYLGIEERELRAAGRTNRSRRLAVERYLTEGASTTTFRGSRGWSGEAGRLGQARRVEVRQVGGGQAGTAPRSNAVSSSERGPSRVLRPVLRG